jgi:hypothetical protein
MALSGPSSKPDKWKRRQTIPRPKRSRLRLALTPYFTFTGSPDQAIPRFIL